MYRDSSAAGVCNSGKKAPGQKHGGRKIFRSHFSATIFLPELGFDSWRIVGMKTPTKLPNQSLEATGRSTSGLSLRQSALWSRGLPVPQLGRSAAHGGQGPGRLLATVVYRRAGCGLGVIVCKLIYELSQGQSLGSAQQRGLDRMCPSPMLGA